MVKRERINSICAESKLAVPSLKVSVQRRVWTDSNNLDSSKQINTSVLRYPKEKVLQVIAEAQEYTHLQKLHIPVKTM